MITPLPDSSFARFTLLLGEPSTRSTLGSLSPTLTNAGAEAWNKRRPATARVKGRLRATENMVSAEWWASVYRVRERIVGNSDGGGWCSSASLMLVLPAACHWPAAPIHTYSVLSWLAVGTRQLDFLFRAHVVQFERLRRWDHGVAENSPALQHPPRPQIARE
jgi:hypothetical protein